MIREEEKTVGRRVILSETDESENYYELDYAHNCYQDIGLFYLDYDACRPGCKDPCYIETVPGGTINKCNSNFNSYAHTYDDLVKVCEGRDHAVTYLLELAVGQPPEEIWEAIKEGIGEGFDDDQESWR